MERRKQIYALAQRFDFIIIEDGTCIEHRVRHRLIIIILDPYYYLQYDSMDSEEDENQPFKFMPSFLSMDVDGRVMRVDSLSKVMAPGMRLGWITSNAVFHDALVTLVDSSTHHPHAFGQVFLTEMLSSSGWKLSGFDRWVRSLRKEYQRRRDYFLNLFYQEVARTGFASTDAPEAGMFIWMKVHLEKHPRFKTGIQSTDGSNAKTNTEELMDELFERILDGGVVVMPASIFMTPSDESSKAGDDSSPVQDVSILLSLSAKEGII